jgi:hypothetical protein
MGLHKITRCIFTDKPISNYEDGQARDAIEYILDLSTHKFLIRLTPKAINWFEQDDFFRENKHVFNQLLNSNNWFKDQQTLITIEKLKDLVGGILVPKTPKEKADNLFQKYLGMQQEDGQIVETEDGYFEGLIWKELFFKSYKELIYYTSYLDKQGLINAIFVDYGSGYILQKFSITVEGLNYGIKLFSEGEKSNLCFIAMAFKPETSNIRDAIKEALIDTGFKPILIDEQNINSDRTINDEIIANLKRCRFCVADFSYHSNGVYFESGFALGQGKKVIYTCLKSEFEKAHFDIKPLQHIIYTTAEQLRKDLTHKINAWIN